MIRVITPPLIEPVSLDEIKAQLSISIDDVSLDPILSRRIKEAREMAEGYMGRALITQTFEERFDSFSSYMELGSTPLLSVDKVTYLNQENVLSTVNSTYYVVDTFNTFGAISPIFNGSWPETLWVRDAVRVEYKAGFGITAEDVPPLIREGIMLLIGHWTNFQNQAENGSNMTRVPVAIRELWDRYIVKVRT